MTSILKTWKIKAWWNMRRLTNRKPEFPVDGAKFQANQIAFLLIEHITEFKMIINAPTKGALINESYEKELINVCGI
jgi:hypothetical protein